MNKSQIPAEVASSNPLAARGLRAIVELAASRDHGDRLRYMAGCRCFACRRANSAYEAARKVARAAGEWNGIVPARHARAHMKALSACGVGRRSVGAACDVADSVLSDILSGRKTNIRASTERAIIGVTADAAGDRALVPARHTWKLLDELIKDGYTRGELARSLGSKSKTPALQLDKKFVTVRSAFLVERMHKELRYTRGAEAGKLLTKLRGEGYTQAQIDERFLALAVRAGGTAPAIAPNKHGRISAKAADLVAQLYREMTT
jgi:hypothetical protein